MAIKEKKLNRRLKFLMNRHGLSRFVDLDKYRQHAADVYKEYKTHAYSEILEIFEIATKLGISKADLRFQWIKETNDQYIRYKRYKGTSPIKERKDNKQTINYGNGGCWPNSIRYPRKKRSKALWRRFYKLFPHLKPKETNKC